MFIVNPFFAPVDNNCDGVLREIEEEHQGEEKRREVEEIDVRARRELQNVDKYGESGKIYKTCKLMLTLMWYKHLLGHL